MEIDFFRSVVRAISGDCRCSDDNNDLDFPPPLDDEEDDDDDEVVGSNGGSIIGGCDKLYVRHTKKGREFSLSLNGIRM